MPKHRLKCDAVHFWSVYGRVKTAELRKNDRNFAVGDEIYLCEYDSRTNVFSGQWAGFVITHVYAGSPLSDGYVMLSLRPFGVAPFDQVHAHDTMMHGDLQQLSALGELPS